MKVTKVVEGVGVAYSGYGSDTIETFGEEHSYIGASSLLPERVGEDAVDGFRTPSSNEGGLWANLRKEYQSQSGRSYPPAYRFRITVEAEELTGDEHVRFWEELVPR